MGYCQSLPPRNWQWPCCWRHRSRESRTLGKPVGTNLEASASLVSFHRVGQSYAIKLKQSLIPHPDVSPVSSSAHLLAMCPRHWGWGGVGNHSLTGVKACCMKHNLHLALLMWPRRSQTYVLNGHSIKTTPNDLCYIYRQISADCNRWRLAIYTLNWPVWENKTLWSAPS